MTELEAIKRAVDAAGKSTVVGQALGLTPQAVRAWKRCPAEHVLKMEALCGGVVTRHDLRSDLYPREEAA